MLKTASESWRFSFLPAFELTLGVRCQACNGAETAAHQEAENTRLNYLHAGQAIERIRLGNCAKKIGCVMLSTRYAGGQFKCRFYSFAA